MLHTLIVISSKQQQLYGPVNHRNFEETGPSPANRAGSLHTTVLINGVISTVELEIRTLPFSSDSTNDTISYNLMETR